MLAVDTTIKLIPNNEFAKVASDAQIERVAKALEANGMKTLIAENSEEAKRLVLDLVPRARKCTPTSPKRWIRSV
jgi:hypothetical protein